VEPSVDYLKHEKGDHHDEGVGEPTRPVICLYLVGGVKKC
jgi:hypothetical protein